MSLAVRPSFGFDLPCPAPEVVARLSVLLEGRPVQVRRTRAPGGGGEGARRAHDHLVLAVPAAEQRVWSPWLTVDITAREGGAHVLARFSPHPSVWTGYAFGYLTLGVGLLFSLVFAGAAAMMGGSPWTLWISAGIAVALAGMWGAAQVGQRLGQGQMGALRAELERAVAGCADPAAAST